MALKTHKCERGRTAEGGVDAQGAGLMMRLFGVLMEYLNDGGHIHRIVAGAPAMDIRHHGDGDMGAFRFSGAIGFGHAAPYLDIPNATLRCNHIA